MKTKHLLALSLFLTSAVAMPLNAQAQAAAPAAAPVETMRNEVRKPLLAAQELLAAKKFTEALALFAEIDAIKDKTPYEAFITESVRGTIAQAAGDTPTTIKSFEKLVESGRLPASEQIKLVQNIGVRYYQLKNYAQAIVWMERNLKDGGEDRKVRVLLIQAYYLNNDYARVISELRTLVAADEKAGRTPEDELLRLWGSAVQQSTDKSGYVEVLEKFVAYYPKKDYWLDLLHKVETKPGFAERLLLDLTRLQLASDSMTSASDYTEMAQLALAAGFPAEAKKILDLAYATPLMAAGTANELKARQKLRDQANKSAADDAKTLGNGEADANKAGKDGNGLVNLGYAFVLNGQFERGLALMERGIAKGLGKRAEDGKLHLGIALSMANRKDDAIKMFNTVGGTEGAAELAKYWILHLNAAPK